MIPADMVSVCPLCTLYKKCVFSPCLYPYQEFVPLRDRLDDYKGFAKFCYDDKYKSPDNSFSGGVSV